MRSNYTANNIDHRGRRRIAFAFVRTRFIRRSSGVCQKILDENGKEEKRRGNSEAALPKEFDILLLGLVYDRLFRLLWIVRCEKGNKKTCICISICWKYNNENGITCLMEKSLLWIYDLQPSSVRVQPNEV